MPLIIGAVMCSFIIPIITKHSLCAVGVCMLSIKQMMFVVNVPVCSLDVIGLLLPKMTPNSPLNDKNVTFMEKIYYIFNTYIILDITLNSAICAFLLLKKS